MLRRNKGVTMHLCLLQFTFFFILNFLFLTGTSDPYVKFKISGKEVFRSRTIHKNLNPVWDEKASLLIENLREPLYVKVSERSAGMLLWHRID